MKKTIFLTILLFAIYLIISCGYEPADDNKDSEYDYENSDYEESNYDTSLKDFDFDPKKDPNSFKRKFDNNEFIKPIFRLIDRNPFSLKCYDHDENNIKPESKVIFYLGYFFKQLTSWKTSGKINLNLPPFNIKLQQVTTPSYVENSIPSITKIDTCIDNLWLEEQICDRDAPTSAPIYCPLIKGNMVCEEINGKGACVEKPCVINGVGVDYQYDINLDGISDSCVAPCDENGKKVDFKYDTNGDGKKDACELPCEVNGKKVGYQFDNNNDGINESCTPPNLCENFDPNSFKDKDAKLYKYNNSWYVGKCIQEGDSTLQTFFCNKDGSMSKDVVECDPLACSKGECKTCYDSDGKGNFGKIAGKIVGVDFNGNYFSGKDECISYLTDAMKDYDCSSPNDTSYSTKFCAKNEVCEDNFKAGTVECVAQYVEPTCTDGDPQPNKLPNFKIKSKVFGVNKKKKQFVQNDGCGIEKDYIIDYVCKDTVIDGKIVGKEYELATQLCPKDTVCQELMNEKDVELACVPIKKKVSCIDSDENKDGSPNFKEIGFTTGISEKGQSLTYNDYNTNDTIYDFVCINGISVKKETKCQSEQIAKVVKENNKEVFKCVSACDDEDALNNPEIFGKVINHMTKEVKPDTCNGNFILQYKCDSITQKIVEVDSKDGSDCTKIGFSKCENGACIK